MSKVLFFNPVCGVSGDMFAGALLDLGLDFAALQKVIADLDLGVALDLQNVERAGVRAAKFTVLDAATGEPVEKHPRSEHRHLSDIRKIIDSSSVGRAVKADAMAVFELIAHAEAKVHGSTVDHVHFHEVGAVDAIVDVLAGAWLFNQLDMVAVCGPVNVGSGTVDCDHGRLPVPAPAVLELLKGMIAYSDEDLRFELATPTGVALLKHFCTDFRDMPKMKIDTIGYGAGSRDLERPNVLRAVVGQSI